MYFEWSLCAIKIHTLDSIYDSIVGEDVSYVVVAILCSDTLKCTCLKP